MTMMDHACTIAWAWTMTTMDDRWRKGREPNTAVGARHTNSLQHAPPPTTTTFTSQHNRAFQLHMTGMHFSLFIGEEVP